MTQKIHFALKMKSKHSKNGKSEFLIFFSIFNTPNRDNVDKLLNWDRLRPKFRVNRAFFDKRFSTFSTSRNVENYDFNACPGVIKLGNLHSVYSFWRSV